METANQQVKIGGRYRHFKGNIYRVLNIVKHSETLEDMVLYKRLKGDDTVWVRPLEMFIETVERDGKVMPRFELIK